MKADPRVTQQARELYLQIDNCVVSGEAVSLIFNALRKAQNDKLEEAERAILNEHSVAESADLNIGLLRAARAVKAIRLSTPEKD